jgi:hypothetical protein
MTREWKVGDRVNWPGTYPNDVASVAPRLNGVIEKISRGVIDVRWPKIGVTGHYVVGSARHFTPCVLDTFEQDGIE